MGDAILRLRPRHDPRDLDALVAGLCNRITTGIDQWKRDSGVTLPLEAKISLRVTVAGLAGEAADLATTLPVGIEVVVEPE